MFCPRCKTEYKKGYLTCVDCSVPLVEVLPEEKTEPHPDATFVKILETNDPTDVAQVRAVLDAENIQYFFQNEQMTLLDPFIQPARLLVAEEDAEKTVKLLKDVKLNFYRMFFQKQR